MSITAATSGVPSPALGSSPATTTRNRIAGPHTGVSGTRARHRLAGVTALLVGADVAAIVGVYCALRPPAVLAVAFATTLLAVTAAVGLYRTRVSPSVLDDLPALALSVFGAAGVARVLLGPGDVGASAVHHVAYFAAAALMLLVPARGLASLVIRRARRAGLLTRRTIIVGSADLAAQLGEVLSDSTYGLRAVGFVDDQPRSAPGARLLPVMGNVADLPAIIEDHRVATVVIGHSNAPESLMVDVIRLCHRADVAIFVVPRFWQVHSVHRLVETVHGVPLVPLRRPASRGVHWRLKRYFDLLVAGVALVLLSPVMAACALAVRLEGGAGVLFRQQRVGLNGELFDVLKFRSLRPATDAESQTMWNVANDHRLGPVGRWLRRLSLDELPQLWNIVRGEMSLVGPRPERPHFVELFSEEHDEYLWRHRVPCGLTGWAQVNGLRGDTSIAMRARFDNYYIENWSLWLDVRILLRTLHQVITAAGR